MTIFKSQKVTELESRVDELVAENASLVAEVEELKKSFDADNALALVQANEEIAALKAHNEEIPRLEAVVKEKETAIGELSGKITELEGKTSPEAINLLVIDAVAASGHTPVEALVTVPLTAEKKDISNLTGREKIAAAISAQFKTN